MIIVVISGGLGNQLFQLSFAYNLQVRLKQKIYLDLSFYEQQNKFYSRIYRKITGCNYRNYAFENTEIFQQASKADVINTLYPNNRFKRLFFYFIEKIFGMWYGTTIFKSKQIYIESEKENEFDFRKYSYFKGYWQNSNYYDLNILNHNNFVRALINNNLEKVDVFNDQITPNNTCLIHIRKTDQMTTFSKSIYRQIDVDFIELSVLKMKKENPSINRIIICSDDINWCKNKVVNLNNINCIDFVENSGLWYDFSLMLTVKYLIISNSTFSWWAAFLNTEARVVYPEKWYNRSKSNFGFIPINWIGA
jgi:hypothetical protein